MEKKILILGQALPEKPVDVPFQRTRLYRWLESVGITKKDIMERFVFNALLDVFPGKVKGKDREPTQEEIKDNIPRLLQLIEDNNIDIVIPVGKLAITAVLNRDGVELQEVIGTEYAAKPFNSGNREIVIIPLPHPSGLSTWTFKDGNKELLEKALEHIKRNF